MVEPEASEVRSRRRRQHSRFSPLVLYTVHTLAFQIPAAAALWPDGCWSQL